VSVASLPRAPAAERQYRQAFIASVVGYDLHIERMGADTESDPVPIPLPEWQAAISTTAGVRPAVEHAATATNPQTGDVISIELGEGAAEVFFPADAKWYPVFRWRRGSVVFSARFEPGDLSHPAWAAAVALASRLGAAIRGDEGEIYFPDDGQVDA
jgi:hypothetical protein